MHVFLSVCIYNFIIGCISSKLNALTWSKQLGQKVNIQKKYVIYNVPHDSPVTPVQCNVHWFPYILDCKPLKYYKLQTNKSKSLKWPFLLSLFSLL